MLRRRIVLGGALVGVLLASGLLLGEQQPSPKTKGRLPPYWSKLGLSDEQKKKAFAIQTEYKDKIDALKRDISKLEEDERKELGKILTDPQREDLRKIIAAKALAESPAEAKTKEPNKAKEQKKPGDK